MEKSQTKFNQLNNLKLSIMIRIIEQKVKQNIPDNTQQNKKKTVQLITKEEL